MWSLFVTVLLTFFGCLLTQETDVCKCVPYFLCKNGVIVDDGDVEGLITERLGEVTCQCKCPDLGSTVQRCCYLRNNNATTTTSTPAPGKLRKCGGRNPNGVGWKSESFNPENAYFGEFPWVVDILVNGDIFRCGGSLIHPSVVLTAAHCVTNKRKTYTARAGEWDNSNTEESYKHQDLRVSSIKIHENYYPSVPYNDIALLFLSGSFNFTEDHIRTVCLPSANAAVSNERCYVTGRGDQSGQERAIPKKISVPLVDKSTCEKNLRKTRLGQYFNLHRSSLCAGEKDKDSCVGDGGGALVCPIDVDDEIYQQMGIVSWGIGCGQENVPGVYTNVQFLRKWIDQQMKEKNLDTSYYTL